MNFIEVVQQGFAPETLQKVGWIQTVRKTPREYFGIPQGTDISSVMEPNHISADLGDMFTYEFSTPRAKFAFGRSYWNRMPPVAQQYLTVVFTENTTSFDNPLGGVEGFEVLNSSWFTIYRGLHTGRLTEVAIQSQNLMMYESPGWGEDNQFTESGRRMMREFLSHRHKLSEIPGLPPQEKVMLDAFLHGVNFAFNSGNVRLYGRF